MQGNGATGSGRGSAARRGWRIALHPFDDASGLLRSLAITLAAGVFLAISGAFATGEAPLALRLAYWTVLMVVGWLWSMLVARFVFRAGWCPEQTWLRVLIAAVAAAIPVSFAVGWVGRLVFGPLYFTGPPLLLFGYVFLVCAVLMLINIAVDRSLTVTSAAPDHPPKFLERLPLKLRGAEIWAVEAEDHYLRLHTSKGQDLILMRLSDAVSELEGIEGAQVHRSWWIARDAITDAERGDGRATLTLRDGSQVPVSRTYARLLRERGWI